MWWAVQAWYLSALYRHDKEAFSEEFEVFELLEPKYGLGVVKPGYFYGESIVGLFEYLESRK